MQTYDGNCLGGSLTLVVGFSREGGDQDSWVPWGTGEAVGLGMVVGGGD